MPTPTGGGFRLISETNSANLATGGLVITLKAAATLLIGDIVYLSAPVTVNKTLVAATNLKRVGVVVGGARFSGTISQDPLDIGEQAALVNEDVLICIRGIAYVVADAAITAGDQVTAATATTAGRAKTATVTTDLVAGDSGRILGLALETASGAAVAIRIIVNPT